MKLSNVILSAMVLVGSSAFASTSTVQTSNATCPHSNKGLKVTDAKSDYVKTVFSQPSAPARGTEKGDGGAVRDGKNGQG